LELVQNRKALNNKKITLIVAMNWVFIKVMRTSIHT
jgi:hypothetical protein